ncbi:MAG: hypothetical protein HY959_01860 [Ignavibacteriae bacterium]|nr:hypothetical protein [Ignavibacteriota bacterium]
MHEEEKHIDVREKLLKLPKVKAGDDFMNSLQRKINLAEAEISQKKAPEPVKVSIWVKLFGKNRNPWLIPSLSLTVVAIFVVSVFVLNSKKITDVPQISDYQKNEKTNGLTPEDKSTGTLSKEQTESKDIAGDLKKDPGKISDEFIGKTSTKTSTDEQPVTPSPTLSPKMEMKLEEVIRPSSSDPVKTESGKVDRKGEERFYQENGKNIETLSPKEKEKKVEDIEQRITDDKSGNIDAINSKGLIEKKDKKESKAMPKSKKTSLDSTKIDQKVLEKIKEEINKEK